MFNVVEWDQSVTDVLCTLGTTCVIRLQIRTATSQLGLDSAEWSGPEGKDGDETDYFTINTGELIHTDHNGDRWLRYRVTFDGDGSATAILEEITINFQ